jgi:hypothetical protein
MLVFAVLAALTIAVAARAVTARSGEPQQRPLPPAAPAREPSIRPPRARDDHRRRPRIARRDRARD